MLPVHSILVLTAHCAGQAASAGASGIFIPTCQRFQLSLVSTLRSFAW